MSLPPRPVEEHRVSMPPMPVVRPTPQPTEPFVAGKPEGLIDEDQYDIPTFLRRAPQGE